MSVDCPSVLLSELAQLECKLKAGSESERLDVVTQLVRIFSEKPFAQTEQYRPFLKLFKQSFSDIAIPIRIKCIQNSIHILLNHAELQDEIIESLKNTQHHADETLRYELIMVIVKIIRIDFRIVSESTDLIRIVKELTQDEIFPIREKAMKILAIIYIKCSYNMDLDEATKKEISWIKELFLHGYDASSSEDRMLVERLIVNIVGEHPMPAKDRMKNLYQFVGTLDDTAMKSFEEMQKIQSKLRKNLSVWLKLHHAKELTSKIQEDMDFMCRTISKELPNPIKSHEFLQKFSVSLRNDINLLRDVETIVRVDVACSECTECFNQVLKKLGYPLVTNLYYKTIKVLLARSSSVLVDRASIEILLNLIADSINNGLAFEEMNLQPELAIKNGLKLLNIITNIYSCHFRHDTILRKMINFFNFDADYVASYILQAFADIGRYNPLINSHAEFLDALAPICKRFTISGSQRQAKFAIRCMYVNALHSCEEKLSMPANLDILPDIIESIKNILLIPNHQCYRTAIVSLGHIAYNMPNKQPQIKKMFVEQIIKGLLLEDDFSVIVQPLGEWCGEECLPEKTRCKVEALKAMARWVMGLKNVVAAQKAFRTLSAFIRGDLFKSQNLSKAEMAWLRLSAGKAMLKICEQKEVGSQYSIDQFYTLSTLMVDPVTEVRELFAKKLHKGLSKGIPHKSLPNDFMGFYALSGRETESKLQDKIRTYISNDVNQRRKYMKTFAEVEKAMAQLPHILPDYMLVFAIPVLTHDPNFKSISDPVELQQIEKCLWMVLEPLITNQEFFCFNSYTNLIQNIKNHQDAHKPDNSAVNHKMYAICDLAMNIILSNPNKSGVSNVTFDGRLPAMFYQAPSEGFQNIRSNILNYLETNLLHKDSIANTAKKQSSVEPPNSLVPYLDDKAVTTSTYRTNSTITNASTIDENTEPPAKQLKT